MTSRTMTLRSIFVMFALVLAGCGGEDSAEPATTVELTTSAVATTAASTTTAPSSTTAAVSEPEFSTEQLEVLDAVAGQHSLLSQGTLPTSDEIERWTSGDLQDTLKARVEASRADGTGVAGAFVLIEIVAVEVDGSAATVEECGVDAISVVAADGSVVTPADEVAFRRIYELDQMGGTWRVNRISFGPVKAQCG